MRARIGLSALRRPSVAVNDHHSHLTEEASSVTSATLGTLSTSYGGWPRLVSLFSGAGGLAQCSNTNQLRLHAGDMLMGTSFYSFFKGAADAAAMRGAAIDAMVLGNHEFDDGDATLANFIGNMTEGNMAPPAFLCANCVPGTTSPLVGKVTHYATKTLSGEKVGIIGLGIKNKTMASSSPSQ